LIENYLLKFFISNFKRYLKIFAKDFFDDAIKYVAIDISSTICEIIDFDISLNF